MPASSRPLAWITPLLLVVLAGPAGAAELEEVESLFRAGKYDECAGSRPRRSPASRAGASAGGS